MRVDDAERDAELCDVVGRHDPESAVRNRPVVLVNRDERIGNDEQYARQRAADLQQAGVAWSARSGNGAPAHRHQQQRVHREADQNDRLEILVESVNNCGNDKVIQLIRALIGLRAIPIAPPA